MASIELNILSLFVKDKQTEEKFYNYIKLLPNLDKDIKLIFTLIHLYYNKYKEKNSIVIQELKSFYELQYSSIRVNKDVHYMLIDELYSININNNLIQDLIEQIVERHYAAIISNKLLPVLEGNKFNIVPSIQEDINNYIKILKNPPKSFQELKPNTKSLEQLLSILENKGLNWHIPKLNDIIGRLQPKSLGLIAAYVDSGKTSFGLTACANFAQQLTDNKCIVYAGNEDPGDRLNIRLTQAFLNITRSKILENFKHFEQERSKLGFSRIKLFDSITTIGEIEKLLEEYQPVILFIDQATNIEISSYEKEINALKSLFRYYRNLAKQHNCHIIGLTQAPGDVINKKWLKLSDIYGSKVVIQGALDYFIGIGRIVDDISVENLRYLNIPKNKLLDGQGGKLPVYFTKEKCLWEQI